jgi:putative membrane protein
MVAAGLLVRRLPFAAAFACGPVVALAHAIGPQPAGPPPLGFDSLPWSFEPWVLACLALGAALYAVGLARLWSHAGTARGVRPAQALMYGAGWATLVVALVSPLDPLGSRLFAAHMVQHELLMIVAAPLLVLGRPLAVWAWALPFDSNGGARPGASSTRRPGGCRGS